jgi:hypothetical protein
VSIKSSIFSDLALKAVHSRAVRVGLSVEVATPGRSVGRPRHCLLHLASVSQGIVFLRTPPTRERALTFQHLSLARSLASLLARCSDSKRLPNISHGRLRKHPLPTTTLTLLLFTYLFSLSRCLVFVLSLSLGHDTLGAGEEVLLIKRQLRSLERYSRPRMKMRSSRNSRLFCVSHFSLATIGLVTIII